jgi:hypothetical protein
VDHARRRAAAKRSRAQVTLDGARFNLGVNIGQAEEILAVDEVLERLEHLARSSTSNRPAEIPALA